MVPHNKSTSGHMSPRRNSREGLIGRGKGASLSADLVVDGVLQSLVPPSDSALSVNSSSAASDKPSLSSRTATTASSTTITPSLPAGGKVAPIPVVSTARLGHGSHGGPSSSSGGGSVSGVNGVGMGHGGCLCGRWLPCGNMTTRGMMQGLILTANLEVFALVQLLAPFFPELAQTQYNATPLVIGTIFAAAPLAQMVTCPIASSTAQRLGRFTVLTFGLCVQSLGCLLFAFATGVPVFLFGRFLQGVGGGCILVAGMAMVMEYSVDIERDVALQETVSGLGCMIGPPLGGLLSAFLDVRGIFVVAAAIPIVVGLGLMVLFKRVNTQQRVGCEAFACCCRAKPRSHSHEKPSGTDQQDSLEAGSLLRSGSSDDLVVAVPERRKAAPTGAGATEDEKGLLSYWQILDRTVMCSALCIFTSACAMNFWDPIMSSHLHALLDTSTVQAGLILTMPSLSYILTCSMAVNPLAARIGNRDTMVLGCMVTASCYMILGPAPFLYLWWIPRQGAWIVTMLALAAAGVGEALIAVPAAPLMLASVEHLRRKGHDPNDHIAATFQQCLSAGEFVGPVVGGLLSQWLPHTREVACTGTDSDCDSTFPWTSSCFGALCLLSLAGLWAWVPSDGPTPKRKRIM